MTGRRFTLTERDGYGRRRKYVIDVFCLASPRLAGSALKAQGRGSSHSAAATHVRECRLECVAAPQKPEYIDADVTATRRSDTLRYSTTGPLRGQCGHVHKRLELAIACLDADDAWCIERGGRTDRRIFAVATPGGWRELNADERAAVERYRSARSKPQPP